MLLRFECRTMSVREENVSGQMCIPIFELLKTSLDLLSLGVCEEGTSPVRHFARIDIDQSQYIHLTLTMLWAYNIVILGWGMHETCLFRFLMRWVEVEHTCLGHDS